MGAVSKRSRRERAARGERTWFEELLFTFMGPPQLGSHTGPQGYTPDPQADLCHRCGQPWDAHERVRTSNMTYTQCPSPQP
jgi:hypothetical protein